MPEVRAETGEEFRRVVRADLGAGGRAAEAEAKASEVVSSAIESGGTQSLNYFIAQKYVEAVGKFATSPNAKTILFPVEATQLMGTLGGIGELTRDVLKDHGNSPRVTTTVPPTGKP